MTTTNETRDADASQRQRSAAQIQAWLVAYLAVALKLDRAEIDVGKTFEAYGLDSAAAVGMTGDLEEWLGYEIDPALPYDHPTIADLAQRLAEAER
jgi:acyl carrier protein